MYQNKVVIYVEGQTEQVLLNHLILTTWNYTDVVIANLKLQAYKDVPCKVPHFTWGGNSNSTIFFQIIDVDGVGSLPSAIANRAKTQHEKGYEIIALRDLSAQDFDCLPQNIDRVDRLVQNFKTALKVVGCHKPDDIELFFSIMTIEAWLLAFTNAIAGWANITEDEVKKSLPKQSLEEIKSPSILLKKIGSKDSKHHHEITSIVSGISAVDIQKVYQSGMVPQFNKFWDKIMFYNTSLSN